MELPFYMSAMETASWTNPYPRNLHTGDPISLYFGLLINKYPTDTAWE